MIPCELFVSCVPGLEPVVLEELKTLGHTVSRASYGGLFVPCSDYSTIYELNLLLRTASRVLLPMAAFGAHDKDSLYEESLQIDWERYFQRMPTFAIDAHVDANPAFTNSLYAAQVLKDAICDRLRKKTGQRPSVDTQNPGVRLSLYIQGKKATISFDTSGKPLHERGYRQDGAVAPLRENLAAALLLLAGYTSDVHLLDPVAGSGTFLVEAALIATNTPPQFLRNTFGFMGHPEYKKEAWFEIREQKLNKKVPLKRKHIVGIEKNNSTFTALQKAMQKAGFADSITAICGDFQKIELQEKPNFVIANPPYGKRLQEVHELEGLYQNLGEYMKLKTIKPARGFILTGNSELAKKIGLRATKKHIVNNGGIDCRLLEFDLY